MVTTISDANVSTQRTRCPFTWSRQICVVIGATAAPPLAVILNTTIARVVAAAVAGAIVETGVGTCAVTCIAAPLVVELSEVMLNRLAR